MKIKELLSTFTPEQIIELAATATHTHSLSIIKCALRGNVEDVTLMQHEGCSLTHVLITAELMTRARVAKQSTSRVSALRDTVKEIMDIEVFTDPVEMDADNTRECFKTSITNEDYKRVMNLFDTAYARRRAEWENSGNTN